MAAGVRFRLILVGAAAALCTLAACGRGSDSAGGTRAAMSPDRSATSDGAAAAPGDGGYTASRRQESQGGRSYGGERADRAPVPMFHGEPMWSENRSHTAQENAEYHFERAGADLGSKTLDDFLTKVHRFGDEPPAGTLKLVRANGDKLLFDPKSDVFAVFTREGAPRTVFKPTDGMSYWNEQKAREEARADGGGEGGAGYRRRDQGDDGGDAGRGRYEHRPSQGDDAG